jgi:hypothetical protein
MLRTTTLLVLAIASLGACGSGDDSSLFGPGDEDGGGAGGGGGKAGDAGKGGSAKGGDAGAGTGGKAGEGGAAAGGESGAGGSGGEAASGANGGSGGEAASGATGGSGGTSGSGGTGGAGGSNGGTSGAGGAAGCPSPTTFHADADDDGYGDPNAVKTACEQPDGYAPNDDDCYDGNAEAHPQQSGWFTQHRGDGSFDYDCDGAATKRNPNLGGCPLTLCTTTEGWQGSVPECGQGGAWITACAGFPLCAATTEPRKQECH